MAYAAKTKVPSGQTRAEIERLLARHKCSQFLTGVDYVALRARVQFRAHDRIVRFELALPDQKKWGTGDRFAQEERRIWRALLLVIRAKLEAVESRIANFEEEFLAHVVMPNDQMLGDILAPIVADAYTNSRMPRALLGTGSEAP